MNFPDGNNLGNDFATQLQQTLDLSRKTVVGVAAAIASPKLNWFGVSGIGNLNTSKPIETNDRFQIGSITKTFVATVVLQLMEEGKLTLESQITQFLPDSIIGLIPNAENITIRQLLNQTSGVPDYTTPLLDFGNNLFREWEPEQLLEFIAGQTPAFAPGESWQYSNSNYVLLGLIVEKITGESIAREIRDRILDPLELSNTFFEGEEPIPGGFVSGYWDINQDGRLDDLSFVTTSIFWSSGSIVSNTQDLLRFGKELFRGDLLQPDTLEQMLTFVDAVGSRAFVKYGLGVAQLRSDKGVIYGHNGLTLGYRANLWYFPQEELFYADLQNSRTINNFLEPILNTALPILDELGNPTVPSIIYDEAISGDISGDSSVPLVLELQKGTNSLTATSVRGDREYVTVKVPEGFQLDSVVLVNYESTDDIAFAAVQEGSIFTEPFRETNVANLLGYGHFGSGLNQVGTDILDDLGRGEGAIGFNGALPSGEYAFWLQQTGATTTYTLDFKVSSMTSQPITPVISFNTINGAFDSEDNLLVPAIVKSLEDGTSLLTFVFSVDGEIPPEGVIVTLNSNIALRDYFANLGVEPFAPGGEFLGAVYNDKGEATGFKFKLTQANALINLAVKDNGKGTEKATFTLEKGADYSVDTGAGSSEVTFYETIDKVPVPSVTPKVGFSVNNNTLSEAMGNSTTLTFTLSEPPPPGGLLVYVKSPTQTGGEGDAAGRDLAEFDIYNAEIVGGAFPAPNFAANGFYFKITEQTASITLSAFADGEVEGIEEFSFELQETPGYTIDSQAAGVTLKVVDDATSLIQVSLTASPQVLVESEGTVSEHKFTLSATPPKEGITIQSKLRI